MSEILNLTKASDEKLFPSVAFILKTLWTPLRLLGGLHIIPDAVSIFVSPNIISSKARVLALPSNRLVRTNVKLSLSHQIPPKLKANRYNLLLNQYLL